MKAWTQWPCPARRGACHGLPEAERHHSGLPRLHPRQQGGAAGAGGQAAGGMAEDPSGVPVPPMSPAPPGRWDGGGPAWVPVPPTSPAPPCRRDGGGPAWVPVPPTSCTPSPPQMMQTNVPGVFAAGDAVTFPLAWRNNRKVNIPHWQMAHAQGTTSPEAAGGGRPSPGPASPQARPSVAALGSCSRGLPFKALQWPVRPASHRRRSWLAATSFSRPLQHPLGTRSRRHSVPPTVPAPASPFPLSSNITFLRSPRQPVQSPGGTVSRTRSSSPLHPLWATRQTL